MKRLSLHSYDPGDLLAGGYQYSISELATENIMEDINRDFGVIKLSWKIQVPEDYDDQLTVYGTIVR